MTDKSDVLLIMGKGATGIVSITDELFRFAATSSRSGWFEAVMVHKSNRDIITRGLELWEDSTPKRKKQSACVPTVPTVPVVALKPLTEGDEKFIYQRGCGKPELRRRRVKDKLKSLLDNNDEQRRAIEKASEDLSVVAALTMLQSRLMIEVALVALQQVLAQVFPIEKAARSFSDCVRVIKEHQNWQRRKREEERRYWKFYERQAAPKGHQKYCHRRNPKAWGKTKRKDRNLREVD